MNRTIRIILAAASIALATIAVNAQSNTVAGTLGHSATVVADYLAANTNAPSATNWTIAPYGSYAKSLKNKYGGGLAAVYYLTPYIGTQIRAQYLDTGLSSGDKVWLPNGLITLQSAYRPFGEGFPLTLRPIIEAGVASDLSGHMYAIAGAGTELDIYTMKPGARTAIQRVSIFYGAEQWQGQGNKFSVQQIGVAVNFNLGGHGFLGLLH